MPASSSRTSPEIPSLTNTTAGTSSSTPMPTSPKDEESIKQVVKDGEDAVDVKELVNEMEGEADDPAVSQVSSLRHKGGRVLRRNILFMRLERTDAGILSLWEVSLELGERPTEVPLHPLCGAGTNRGGGGARTFHILPLSSRQPHISRQRSPPPAFQLSSYHQKR
jgi:hypothetical protein